MSKKAELFKLYEDIKSSAADAQRLELQELSGILTYVSDRLVIEYHNNCDDPLTESEALNWDKEKWPSATALLLEMKSMIRSMNEAEANDDDTATG